LEIGKAELKSVDELFEKFSSFESLRRKLAIVFMLLSLACAGFLLIFSGKIKTLEEASSIFKGLNFTYQNPIGLSKIPKIIDIDETAVPHYYEFGLANSDVRRDSYPSVIASLFRHLKKMGWFAALALLLGFIALMLDPLIIGPITLFVLAVLILIARNSYLISVNKILQMTMSVLVAIGAPSEIVEVVQKSWGNFLAASSYLLTLSILGFGTSVASIGSALWFKKVCSDVKKTVEVELAVARNELEKRGRLLEQTKDIGKKVFAMGQRFVQLQAVTKAIARSLDPEKIMEEVVRVLPQLLAAKKAAIFAVEKGKMIMKKHVGLDPISVQKMSVLPLDESVNVLVYVIKEKVVLSPAETSENFALRSLLNTSEVKPLLAAPMTHGEEQDEESFKGVIAIFEYNEEKDTEALKEDSRILAILAALAGMSIQNAMLFKKTELLANVDGLTGLYTHRYMQEFLDRELERAKRYKHPVSIVLTDIDHFKKFNDVYGHQVGDMVLAETARIMRETVRKSDLPARYGGEEFMAILPETDYKGAFAFAERLRKKVESSTYTHPETGQPLKVTISVGVATFPLHADEKNELIKQADEALYRAKESGRNRVCIAEIDPKRLSEFERFLKEGEQNKERNQENTI